MKKTKRALISMLVFMTVFCLTIIFNIPFFFQSHKGIKSKTEEVTTTKSSVLAEGTQDARIQSFSYNTDENTTLADASPAPQERQISAMIEEATIPDEVTEEPADMSVEEQNVPAPADESDALSETTADNASAESDAAGKETDTTSTKKPDENTKVPATKEDTKEKEPEAQYADIGIAVPDSYVNIRKEASTDSSVLGKLYRDSAAEILKTKGDWYYISSGNLKGYVKSEFIKTGIPDKEIVSKYGTKSISVSVDGLNVRKEPSTESNKVTVVYKNEVYPVVEVKGDWIKIKIDDDNTSGYIKSEYAELLVKFKEAVSKEEEQKLLQIEAEERAKKETEIKYNGGVDYSSYDLKLLACLIHSEAGTQSYEGKLAVANVVLNRVKSSRYPDTIKAVVYQSGQFSVAKSGSLQKQLDKYGSYSSNSQLLSIKAAKDALEGSNNIGSRLYFHSYKAAARKGYDKKSSAVKIDGHLFW